MSLIVAVICNEGIALAADSKSTIVVEHIDPETGERKCEASGFVTLSEKLMVTDGNVVVGITGRDRIKGRKGMDYLKEHLEQRPGMTVKQVAEEVRRIIQENKDIREMEVMIAGYGKKPWVYVVTSEKPERMRKTDYPCVWWMGQEDIMDRIMGHRMTRIDGKRKVEVPEYEFMFAVFSLQDAIDLAVLGVEMTQRVMRFQDREQTVGGPIDVVAITKEGVTWVARKRLKV